ncbi:MAG TPA: STAS domain-containing protein [Spirochaetota bacterium]|nr:STAS domain-containing protein [Spirochaetota bacterium]HOD14774.1 STAS domain-containing protein [Spirochaetota bacterium]HPG49098.1 STAS domain-containing protein [Spirochaetota bacterium]HPN11149.1 STAS domain-containing protein [Spirochaetota bacterium]HQL82246.1 STAS domain-containing protein [Spirochaetota bacterium]
MAQIIVPGDVSVKTVKEFHRIVREALQQEGTIVLNFRDVKRIDLAVMQILVTLSKECGKINKGLRIRSASDEIKKQIRICGIIK